MRSRLIRRAARMAAVGPTIFVWCFIGAGIAAEVAEVVAGVHVTKKTYNAPNNEQPFFGFMEKTPELRDRDAKFVAAVVSAVGSYQKAFDETLRRGWVAFSAGDYAEAGRRFNQGYLIDSSQSAVYHGFAALAEARFGDAIYADELFRAAKTRPNPMRTLSADYGRLLLVMKRPRDAQPVLEQAVIEAPEFGTAWSNLAWARYYNGDRTGACAAAGEAVRKSNSMNIQSDLRALTTQAKCD